MLSLIYRKTNSFPLTTSIKTSDWLKRCHKLDQVDSTNTHALREVKEGKPSEGTFYATSFQTNGQGQRDKFWHSERDKNALVSFVYYPVFLAAKDGFLLNMAVCLSVVDVVESLVSQPAFIKWPNDVYVGNAKIAGILIQNQLLGNTIDTSIIGIGINVNQVDFPDHLANPTSIAKVSNRQVDVDDVLKRLAASLDRFYALLKRGEEEELFGQYHARLYLRDRDARFLIGKDIRDGRIRHIEKDGHIVIDFGNEVRKFNHGEIEFLI